MKLKRASPLSRWLAGIGPRRDPSIAESSSMRDVARFSPPPRTLRMREWLPQKTSRCRNIRWRTPDRCAERDDIPEIRRLLKAGVDVSFRGESDWTRLPGRDLGLSETVKLLLESRGSQHHEAFSFALRLAKTAKIADLLFAAGADVNARIGDDHIIGYWRHVWPNGKWSGGFLTMGSIR